VSDRIKKVNQLLKREVSQLVLREIESNDGSLTTITRADTSPNLRNSKIFVSVIPEEKQTSTVKFLNRNIYKLQQKINKRLHMRPVPKLKFVEDNKILEEERIDRLFEKLKNEKN